jgi:transposase
MTRSIRIDGKKRSEVVERIGSVAELKEKLGDIDPIEWAENYVKEMTRLEKEGKREIIVKYAPYKMIKKNEQHLYSGGYLFLQRVYYDLGLNKICKKISKKYKFEYDLDSVLSRLVYGRILFPASKLATYELSNMLLEKPNIELQHIYRALEVIGKEMDVIQAELYKLSTKVIDRHTGVLYYDCTNFFFEIEQEEDLKQYGYSKEHRPNPIVQMGLFMDGNGLPLAFSINAGNTNEQVTLKPLEKKILSDFQLSKFVVCTDAGLSSTANRMFNNIGDRAFITTQSVKKLKKHLKDWALDSHGWSLSGSSDTKVLYNLNEIDEEVHKESTFYKEQWINEDGLVQKLIVTYSVKYKNYQKGIRNRQIERAQGLVNTNPAKIGEFHQNDYKRFIGNMSVTSEGEVAEKNIYFINEKTIKDEEIFDGFYAVCTNLEDDVSAIVAINHKRWEIEECFRIMKHEFKARPVYVRRDLRIQAHFLTCFISLLIYRILEKRLDEKYTCEQIISELRDMYFLEVQHEGYIPAYTRTDFTDDLHTKFGFRTDYEILTTSYVKSIIKQTKQ